MSKNIFNMTGDELLKMLLSGRGRVELRVVLDDTHQEPDDPTMATGEGAQPPTGIEEFNEHRRKYEESLARFVNGPRSFRIATLEATGWQWSLDDTNTPRTFQSREVADADCARLNTEWKRANPKCDFQVVEGPPFELAKRPLGEVEF